MRELGVVFVRMKGMVRMGIEVKATAWGILMVGWI